MMYSAETIAEYVIHYCDKKGKIMTNLKLQKILYFIQVNFLVTIDNPCFKEDIFAWGFGPVIPEVYRKYKAYGSTHIPATAFAPRVTTTSAVTATTDSTASFRRATIISMCTAISAIT